MECSSCGIKLNYIPMFQNLRDECYNISWGFIEILGFESFLEMLIIDFLIIIFMGFSFGFLFDRIGLVILSFCVYICIFYYHLSHAELKDF